MKRFTEKHFTIFSTMQHWEAATCIEKEVSIENQSIAAPLNLSKSATYFVGNGAFGTYFIEPDLDRRNIGKPLIQLNIESLSNGCCVQVKMHLKSVEIWALLLFSAVLIIFGISCLSFESINNKNNVLVFAFIFFVLMLFWLFFIINFEYQSRASKKKLYHIFKTEIKQ